MVVKVATAIKKVDQGGIDREKSLLFFFFTFFLSLHSREVDKRM